MGGIISSAIPIRRKYKYGIRPKRFFYREILKTKSLQDMLKHLELSSKTAYELFKIFIKMDLDCSGEIDMKEFHRYFRMKQRAFTERMFFSNDFYVYYQGSSTGVNDIEADDSILVDYGFGPKSKKEEPDGSLNFQEFIFVIWRFCTYNHYMMAEISFEIFDNDDNEQLCAEEIDALLRMVNYTNHSKKQEIQFMKTIEERSNNNIITKEDFISLVCEQQERQEQYQKSEAEYHNDDGYNHTRQKKYKLSNILERFRRQRKVSNSRGSDIVEKCILNGAFAIQDNLRERVIGKSFWRKASQKRMAKFGSSSCDSDVLETYFSLFTQNNKKEEEQKHQQSSSDEAGNNNNNDIYCNKSILILQKEYEKNLKKLNQAIEMMENDSLFAFSPSCEDMDIIEENDEEEGKGGGLERRKLTRNKLWLYIKKTKKASLELLSVQRDYELSLLSDLEQIKEKKNKQNNRMNENEKNNIKGINSSDPETSNMKNSSFKFRFLFKPWMSSKSWFKSSLSLQYHDNDEEISPVSSDCESVDDSSYCGSLNGDGDDNDKEEILTESEQKIRDIKMKYEKMSQSTEQQWKSYIDDIISQYGPERTNWEKLYDINTESIFWYNSNTDETIPSFSCHAPNSSIAICESCDNVFDPEDPSDKCYFCEHPRSEINFRKYRGRLTNLSTLDYNVDSDENNHDNLSQLRT